MDGFRFCDMARSWLKTYGLSEEQIRHVEGTEWTWRMLNKKPRVKSQATLLREQAKRLEKLERARRRA